MPVIVEKIRFSDTHLLRLQLIARGDDLSRVQCSYLDAPTPEIAVLPRENRLYCCHFLLLAGSSGDFPVVYCVTAHAEGLSCVPDGVSSHRLSASGSPSLFQHSGRSEVTQQARARHEPHMRQNGSAHEFNL